MVLLAHLEIVRPVLGEEFSPNDIFRSLENAQKYLEFLGNVRRVFQYIKSDIGSSPMVFTKVCRLLKHVQERTQSLRRKKETPEEKLALGREIEAVALEILRDYLLVGLPVMECNPGIASQVWVLVESYNYIVRYQMYEDWLTRMVGFVHTGRAHPEAVVQPERVPAADQTFFEGDKQRQRSGQDEREDLR